MGGSRTQFFSQWNNGNMVTVDQAFISGDVFFVDSGKTTTGGITSGFGSSPDRPFLTLDSAIANCAENNGDHIFVLPGHAETIIADSGVDIDKAGITIIGLGRGAARPTFTFQGNVAADFKLAAASTVIKNLLFLNNLDNTTGIVEVSAPDCQILGCEFREADIAAFADVMLLTTAAADRLTIKDLVMIGNAGDGAVSGVSLVGADDLVMENIRIYGDYTSACIHLHTTASLRGEYKDLYLFNEDATAGADAIRAMWDEITGSTGTLRGDIQAQLGLDAANTTGAITCASMMYFGKPCSVGPAVVNAVKESPVANDYFPASTDA